MGDPVDRLEQRREELYEALAGLGDFRRGSVNETYRRCGKPNCGCADAEHPGHGPRYLWTRSVHGKTRSRQLSPAEVDIVRGQLARYRQFAELAEQIVEVNEAICQARPPDSVARPPVSADGAAAGGGEKGGSSAR